MKCARVLAAAAALFVVAHTQSARADAWATTRSCRDPVIPVGSFCRRYGDDWGSEWPPFSISLSFRTLSYIPSRGGSFDGTGGTAQTPLSYSYSGSALGNRPLRAYGAETNLLWLPLPYFYLGVDFGAGAGAYNGPDILANNARITPSGSPNVTEILLGGIAGVRLPAGPISIRGDVVLGGEWVFLSQRAYQNGNEFSTRSNATSWLVEPRLGIDYWVTPYATIGAFVSMPSMDREATNFGIGFAGHFRAFDGEWSMF